MYSVVMMMALTSGVDTMDCGGGRRGCGGGRSQGSCCGCYGGGYGGGYGGYSGGGSGCGCYGGGYGGGYAGYQGGGYGGGYAAQPYYGGGCYGGGYYAQPWAPTGPQKMPKPEGKVNEEVAAPATLQVSLPADAKLTVDGSETSSKSSTRTFVSPVLPTGKTFQYTLKAEFVRDGQTVSVEKVVSVSAGNLTNVNFEETKTVASR